jgi:GR25 family glycosyltransferase involved in LPS biosynthesis
MELHRLNRDFDKVVCINLSERPDKRNAMQKKFDELGIKVEWFTTVQFGFAPKIIDAIEKAKVGHFNANQPFEIGPSISHYSVIKQAFIEKCENIFVFEDDVRFHGNFNEKLDKYLDDLPQNWEVILLYSFMYDILPENIRVSKRWIKSFRAWSLMSYGMKREFMKKYIESQDNFWTISDMVTYRLQETKQYNIYSAIPTLCIPEVKLGSNVRGENMNYNYTPTILNRGYSDDHYI